MSKPPFDPVKAAWILLLVMVGGVILKVSLDFAGCAIMHEPSICARTGEAIRDVSLELVAAVALLIGARR